MILNSKTEFKGAHVSGIITDENTTVVLHEIKERHSNKVSPSLNVFLNKEELEDLIQELEFIKEQLK